MSTKEWYQPLQDKALDFLKKDYIHADLVCQDVVTDKVYQAYVMIKKDGGIKHLLVVLFRQTYSFSTYQTHSLPMQG